VIIVICECKRIQRYRPKEPTCSKCLADLWEQISFAKNANENTASEAMP
jgi:hypothetical protein